MNRFERPIPGQSLTTTPKNAPYERPPEIADPELAIQVHLARLSEPEMMEEALFHLEMGLDLVSLTEGYLRSAVMAGVHSIDVSLIAAPVIHEYIKSTADALGIEYDEGFENKEAKDRARYARNAMLAKDKMEKAGVSPKETARQIQSMPQEPMMEEPMAEEPMMPEEAPRGLMARSM
jgi:hypothetical protein